MDQAQVSRTVLAARRKTTIEDVIALARKYPDRTTAAVRIKGAAYRDKPVSAFRKFLAKQTNHPKFARMAEVLMYHAQDRQERQDYCSPGGHPARQRQAGGGAGGGAVEGLAFIIHIEFASLGARRVEHMKEMKAV